MQTNNIHEYHGITFRNDGTGWFIQIKLLGRYRQLRAFTSDPETAARRFDLALFKLEAFTPPSTVPNFPDDFSALTLNLDGDAAEDLKDYVASVKLWFRNLCDQVTAAGGDVEEMLTLRNQSAAVANDGNEAKRARALVDTHIRIMTLSRKISFNAELPLEKKKAARDLFAQLSKLFAS